MKCTVTKENLTNALKKVLTAVSSRTTLPVLSNVLIEAEGEYIRLTTTDLEVTIMCDIPAIITEPGATTLPAKKFGQIISLLSKGDVKMETDDNQSTSITCNKSSFKIVGLDPQGFPKDTEFNENWSLTMKADRFSKSLSKVSYARSTDETRVVLNGVLLSLRSGVLTFATTDGRRLALVETLMENIDAADGDVILPAKVTSELEKIMNTEEEVTIRISDSQASFEFQNTFITSKLVEGTYPNYRQVIPNNFENSVAIPREQFINVLNRISIVVSESSAAITMNIDGVIMDISANSPEFGEANEPMEVAYEGKKITISFNPVFLREPLKHLECDQLIIQFNDEYSPIAISGDDGFLYIIMPMSNE